MREFNIFLSDSWRVTPSTHGQRGPALRAAESVLPDQRQLHDPDGRVALWHLGRRQHRQTRHAHRHAARVRPLPCRPVRVQRRSQQPGAQHRRGVAGPALVRLHEVAARQRRRRRRRARRMGDGLPASGPVGLHRSVWRQPGHCRVAAEGSEQRDTPDSAAQHPDAAGGSCGDAAGATRVPHHARQRLRSGHPAAVHPVVVGRLAAQGVARLGDRAALCRQQVSRGPGIRST